MSSGADTPNRVPDVVGNQEGAGLVDRQPDRSTARVLVCIEGAGQVEHGGATYAVGKGDVVLLPAVIGACTFRPRHAVSVLEIAIPE